MSKLHDAFFQPKDEPVTHPVIHSFTEVQTPAPVDIPAAPVDSDTLLTRLQSKTDFDATPVGKSVKELLATLDGMELTDPQKMTIALKIGAKDGLTGDKILSTLQGLVDALNHERDNFQHVIDANDTHAKDVQASLDAARKQVDDLSTELLNVQSKSQRAQTQFQTAYSVRMVELTKSIDHFKNIIEVPNVHNS